MARTEHLPIYKQAYDLCLYLEQVVRGFARYHKPVLSSERCERIEGYTIGTDLRETARRVVKLIVRANARRDRSDVLLEIREEVEQLKVLLRLALPRYARWKDGRYSGYSDHTMGRPFFAYLLRCADESYYVGHTDELTRRLQEHQEGGGCAYTTTRRPVTLVWSEEFATRELAKEAETRIKGWSPSG